MKYWNTGNQYFSKRKKNICNKFLDFPPGLFNFSNPAHLLLSVIELGRTGIFVT
jgi:hypothetical protein